VKVDENKEIPDLLSLHIRFVCEISQQNSQISPQIGQKSYILEFSSKTYTSYIYIGMEGVV
jgi:hypothetical protein